MFSRGKKKIPSRNDWSWMLGWILSLSEKESIPGRRRKDVQKHR
jgi:hypothetical protein